MADFGFDKDIKKFKEKKVSDTPIHRFDIEEMARILKKRKLPTRHPYVKFINEIYWGTGKDPGDLRLWISPEYSIGIEKLHRDLKGENTWVLKKHLQINRDGFGGYELSVADEVFDQIEWLDKQPLDTPKKEFKEFENLVVAIASKMRRVAKEEFIFDGVTKLSENNYIIRLNVRGQGVQAQDQKRVLQLHTNVVFEETNGKIHIFCQNVETPLSGYVWDIMPSDRNLYFLPTQSRDEISECLGTFIRWY
jgi:hypothetical protein